MCTRHSVCIWYLDHTLSSRLIFIFLKEEVNNTLLTSGETVCSIDIFPIHMYIFDIHVFSKNPLKTTKLLLSEKKTILYIIITCFSLNVKVTLKHILQCINQKPKLNLVYPLMLLRNNTCDIHLHLGRTFW